MKGFIIAHGRSGTMWIAHALRECCGLDARHESMGYDLGDGFGGAESNSRLWRDVPLIRERFPDAGVIQLVRDGRKVVRSVLTRNPDRTVERACLTWAGRNLRLMREIPPRHRFRLEDLVTDLREFVQLAQLVGANHIDLDCWKEERVEPKNATVSHSAPPFEDWATKDQETFWRVCGDVMEELGYTTEGRE